jgi:hypothetical protein
MQGTADFHHTIANTRLPQAPGVVDDATALEAAVGVRDTHVPPREAPIHRLRRAYEGATLRLPGGHDDFHMVECARQDAQILEQPAARGQGGGRAIRLSCMLPACVPLRKRIISAAWINKMFFTVWHVFWPRSWRVGSVGSWGHPMRRSVPSCPPGGRRAQRRGESTWEVLPSPLPRWPRPLRCAELTPSRTGLGHPPARATSPAAPPMPDPQPLFDVSHPRTMHRGEVHHNAGRLAIPLGTS